MARCIETNGLEREIYIKHMVKFIDTSGITEHYFNYTQLQKKRTTYMYLPLSKILTSDSYVICGYIALKFCMLLLTK